MNEKKEWMIAPTHTLIRYLLEDLRISHVGGVSSSSSFLVALFNIHIRYLKRLLIFLICLPTINLLHCRSNEPCRRRHQQR
jgi:hypothetical protein